MTDSLFWALVSTSDTLPPASHSADAGDAACVTGRLWSFRRAAIVRYTLRRQAPPRTLNGRPHCGRGRATGMRPRRQRLVHIEYVKHRSIESGVNVLVVCERQLNQVALSFRRKSDRCADDSMRVTEWNTHSHQVIRQVSCRDKPFGSSGAHLFPLNL